MDWVNRWLIKNKIRNFIKKSFTDSCLSSKIETAYEEEVNNFEFA